jgi:hypothetical protein
MSNQSDEAVDKIPEALERAEVHLYFRQFQNPAVLKKLAHAGTGPLYQLSGKRLGTRLLISSLGSITGSEMGLRDWMQRSQRQPAFPRHPAKDVVAPQKQLNASALWHCRTKGRGIGRVGSTRPRPGNIA